MPDDKPASTGRNPDGTFAPGNSINPRGRPRGSRNKLGEAFFNDLYAEWQAHGPEVITKVREERPEVFLKVVASTLPKDLNITNENVFDDYSTEELDRAIRALLNEIAEQEAAAEDDEAKPADGLH